MCNITIQQIIEWIQANWAYVIAGASFFKAVTPTPNPNTTWGRLYRAIEYIGLNFGKSKQTGVPTAQALQQAVAALEKEPK